MTSQMPGGPPTAAERSKADILEWPRQFAEKGYSGARVDEIAAKTQTSKRMIYYYFRDKEGLFTAVLEEGYRRMRALERRLDVESLDPIAAMRALVAATFDYQAANEPFVRLVMVENIHRGEHLQKTVARGFAGGVLEMVADVYRRGVADCVFREGLTPLDIHMTISALSFFNVSATRLNFLDDLRPRHDQPDGVVTPPRGCGRDSDTGFCGGIDGGGFARPPRAPRR